MSDVSRSTAPTSPRDERSRAGAARLRPAIADLLSQLKRKIRAYVLLEGAALLAVACGLLFWLTFLLDWAYFRLTALELPLWFRESAAIGAVALVAGVVVFWIVLRYFARFRARALALVLERRFPELNNRLITAVELASAGPSDDSPLTSAMLERTVDEAVRLSSGLSLESVFDRAPLRRSLAAAAAIAVSVVALGLLDSPAFARWFHAFVARDGVYWQRETRLVVKAVMQPGDRIREFQNGELKHPRGVDLVLLVEAPEGSKPPASVELEYVLDANRGSARIEMIKNNERQFRHTVSGLLDSLSLWVSGGDYVMRTPLRVEVVDPPRLDQVTLDCQLPEYTGQSRDNRGSTTRRTIEVQSSQVTLPLETAFVLDAKSNKPLVAFRIETETRRISLTRERSTIAARTATGDFGVEQPLPAPSVGPFLTASGNNVAIPFLLTTRAQPATGPGSKPDRTKPGSQPVAKPAAVADSETGSKRLSKLPIAIAADTRMRIELEDTDGISSIEPIRLLVNGLADQPPVIQTELRGIGTSITRKATIPVAGTIRDDYGIAKAQFEFRVGDEKDWRICPFRRPPAGIPKEHFLRRDETDNVERFEVLPLDLKVGQRLALSVVAQDGDNLNGPHTTRGEEYVFQIVSDEELLSLLYVKEVNLRERFEKIISELEKVQRDLGDHRSRAAELAQRNGGRARGEGAPGGGNGGSDRGGESESLRDLETAVAVCASRSLFQVRQKSVETASIEDSFRALLEELVNNAVHTQQMVDRIGLMIVQPLHRANEKDYPAADEAIGLYKLAVENGRDAVPQIDNSVRAVATVIARLKRALAEMQDLVKFHEAISRLQSMIKDQERIIDETRQEQKKNRLKELEGLK